MADETTLGTDQGETCRTGKDLAIIRHFVHLVAIGCWTILIFPWMCADVLCKGVFKKFVKLIPSQRIFELGK